MEKMASAVVAIAGKAIKGEERDGDRRQVRERGRKAGEHKALHISDLQKKQASRRSISFLPGEIANTSWPSNSCFPRWHSRSC